MSLNAQKKAHNEKHLHFHPLGKAIKRMCLLFIHELFQIKDCRVYLAKDGTEIQDEGYFETIEPQTLFVIASPSELIKTGL